MAKAVSSSLNSQVIAGLPSPQVRLDSVDNLAQRCRLLVTALGFLVQLVAPPLDGVQIGENQLCCNRLDVANGVDVALDVMNVIVLEAAYHVHDGVHLADVT